METITKSDLYNELHQEQLVAFLNHPHSIVETKIVSLDFKNRTGVINVNITRTENNEQYRRNYDINVKFTKNLYYWFYKRNPVLDDQGEPTGEMLTNYQKYLIGRGIDIKTPISKIVFKSENHSDKYADNPFRLSVYPKFGNATMYSVVEPKHRPMTYCDPTNPGEIKTRYVMPRRADNGHVIRLKKENYRRLEICGV